MCDVSTAFSIVSGIIGFIGSQQKSNAEQQQAAFNAQVARNNEILAQRQAEDAVRRGEAAAAKQGEQTRQFKARQRTALAGGGIQVGVGSALDLSTDVSAVGREEEAIIRRNAEREALGFRTQGMNFAASAELAVLRGEQSRRAAGINALGTLLTVGSTFSQSSLFNKRPTGFTANFADQGPFLPIPKKKPPVGSAGPFKRV